MVYFSGQCDGGALKGVVFGKGDIEMEDSVLVDGFFGAGDPSFEGVEIIGVGQAEVEAFFGVILGVLELFQYSFMGHCVLLC